MSFLFSLCFALALAHQLDAVRARVWRVLPGLNGLSEEAARTLFVALHIPVLLIVFECAFPAEDDSFLRMLIALLGPLNFGLHRLLDEHPYYDFNGVVSQGLVIAYAAVGGLYFLLALAL